MKGIIVGIALALCFLSVYADENKGRLENDAITWQWDLSSGNLSSMLKDKADGALLNVNERVQLNFSPRLSLRSNRWQRRPKRG